VGKNAHILLHCQPELRILVVGNLKKITMKKILVLGAFLMLASAATTFAQNSLPTVEDRVERATAAPDMKVEAKPAKSCCANKAASSCSKDQQKAAASCSKDQQKAAASCSKDQKAAGKSSCCMKSGSSHADAKTEEKTEMNHKH
jgi:hypothetical protein